MMEMPSCAQVLILLLQLRLALTFDDGNVQVMKEIQEAGEAAVISVGSMDALSDWPEIAHYLETDKDYAAESRALAKNAVLVGTLYLGRLFKLR